MPSVITYSTAALLSHVIPKASKVEVVSKSHVEDASTTAASYFFELHPPKDHAVA